MRIERRVVLAVCALAFLLVPAVRAEDEDVLREEIRKLRDTVNANEQRIASQDQQIRSLTVQQRSLLERDVATYLADSQPYEGAQADNPLAGVTISARLTGVVISTLGLDPVDRAVGDGDVDLDFDFQVTDNLDAFIHLTANNVATGGFEGQFGESTTNKATFGTIAAPTAGGLFDGVGVDGTQTTRGGSVTTYEVGVHHQFNVGNTMLHWEAGQLDPRNRFSQNAFADDENTQFLNNNFDDPASVPWISVAPTSATMGLHMWVNLGDQKQYTVSWGMFTPVVGQIFDNPQVFVQFSWKGQIQGRDMNLRIFGFIDAATEAATDDDVSGGGASWDWYATEKIGVFVRVTGTGGDSNPVELDFSVGVVLTGPVASRPDDTLGIGFAWLSLQTVTAGSLAGEFTPTEDDEFTIEIYYRFMLEEGKLQITPGFQYVNDPGGGVGWSDDALFLLYLRFHVPF